MHFIQARVSQLVDFYKQLTADEISLFVEYRGVLIRSVMEYWGGKKNPSTPTLHYVTTPAEPPTRVRTRTHTPWREIWNTIVHEHRRRSVLGFVLMLTQAFFYNAIFFTYGLVLMRFYDVPAQNVGGYLVPFALGNVLGPIVLGHLFDTIGRKKMIAATYALSGILLAITGWLFHAGLLTAQTQTIDC